MSVAGSGNTMWLLMEGWRQSWGSKKRQPITPRRWPLQFDRGTNCVYIGIRNYSLEELGINTQLEIDGPADPDTYTAPGEDGSGGLPSSVITSSATGHNLIAEDGVVNLESAETSRTRSGEGSSNRTLASQAYLATQVEHRRAKPSGSLRRMRVDPYMVYRTG